MNAHELARAMIEARADCDAAFDEERRAILEDAEADRKFEIAWSSAYLASSGTVGERDAHCKKATADERYAAKVAEGMRRSAYQGVEYRIRCLSALQSLASLTKAEAQLANWEPREVSA